MAQNSSFPLFPAFSTGAGANGIVFGEPELKSMRDALDTVCKKLHLHAESDDARRAALAILRHASEGASFVQLAQAVETEMLQERHLSEA